MGGPTGPPVAFARDPAPTAIRSMNIHSQPETFLATPPPAPQPRRRRARAWALLSILALAATAFLGMRYLYPHTITGIVMQPSELHPEIRGPGTLDALREVTISAPLQARLVAINVDRNDTVAKGDVLARLEFDDLTANVAAAEASWRAAEHAIRAAQADHDRAQAVLDNARATYKRQSALVADGFTSEASRDSALASLRQAEADVARTERTSEQAEAEHEANGARLALARAQLDESVVRAPLDGIVVSRARNVGDVLTPGVEIVRVVDPASVVLTARFDESVIASAAPGQAAMVGFAGQAELPGHVLRLGRLVDEETREFEVDIALDRLPPNWALGQRGMARIRIASKRGVLAVPTSYVVRRDGEAGLWVAAAGRARWRAVRLGAEAGDVVEIGDGLSAGETVLHPDGVYALMRVDPQSP